MVRSAFDIIPSHQIDADKWDNCIKNRVAGRIYARYIYLQHLADNWSGLVMNDYAAVMPLVWRSKWGIRYAYDAPFIQQLGLFGSYEADNLSDAIVLAMRYTKYGDLFFNTTNKIEAILPAVRMATNLVVPLHSVYQDIRNRYNNHLKAKLKKPIAQSLQYATSDDIELAVGTYLQLYAQRFPSVKAENYQRLIALAKQLIVRQQCFVRKVANKDDSLLAIALFWKDENRIYNILPSTTEDGRRVGAMHFLLDNVIQEFAGKSILLDLEGSDVPGIKAFYQSFGAVNEPFYHFHYNCLPVPLRWLKR